jgi:hypothetical protein
LLVPLPSALDDSESSSEDADDGSGGLGGILARFEGRWNDRSGERLGDLIVVLVGLGVKSADEAGDGADVKRAARR